MSSDFTSGLEATRLTVSHGKHLKGSSVSHSFFSAALVARCLSPQVMDYLVFSHRSTEPGHRLLLIHLQMQPLMDLELRMGQGIGTMLAWPLLKAAERLLSED